MKILLVGSECAPVAKVGGLADVVGSLPKALKSLRVDVSVILPFYKVVKIKKSKLRLVKRRIPVFFNQKEESFNLWKTFLPKSRVPLLLVENNKYFFGKGVYVESDASSGGSEKEAARFLFLSTASIEIAKMMKADILHCQDWHTALIPYLIKKESYKIKTLLTIHNLGYQGIYKSKAVNKLLGTRFPGKQVNCLKLGILTADFINTVSPSYAKEILTRKYGAGLQKYLKRRKKHLIGIVNGLDLEVFNPKTDPFLKKRYSWKNIKDKSYNKIYLQKKCFKKANLKIPILGIVSRLADQKGFDLIKGIFRYLIKEELQFILLGKGSKKYEKFFQQSVKRFPEKCCVKIGFDEKLAHQIYGGADMFLMPSFFEPCGLGQQIAMKYGTVPVARAVGGIKNTVFPVKIKRNRIKGNGFLFNRYSQKDLFESIKKALGFYEKKDIWKQIQINGMKQDFSWKKSAKKYKSLYKKILD
ncbi:MAG: glycogen synthase [Candidatus Nealsonbacteria bacterium]|nr:MAG: glycogen synthase [Candidatus Nealsonbacteria bacterium]